MIKINKDNIKIALILLIWFGIKYTLYGIVIWYSYELTTTAIVIESLKCYYKYKDINIQSKYERRFNSCLENNIIESH